MTTTRDVCKDLDVLKDLSKRVDAISNENRLKLLIIIGRETNNTGEFRKSTYLRSLGHSLKKDYGISISLTAIKNHLAKLLKAGLIKKEAGFHDNKPVTNYFLIPGALEALSMDINTINNKLANVQEEIIKSSYELPILKVLGGEDDGKIFPITKESVRIGRRGDVDLDDPEYQNDVVLSNSYESVSRVFKPHATLKLEDGKWMIEDKESKCGVYLNSSNSRNSNITLKNKDKIRLALGNKGAELVFISEV